MGNAVEIRGLTKTLGGFSLRDIDLDVPEGYVVGLVGENGAGKTTLIKCITGAVNPDGGTVSLFGGDRDLGRVGVVFDECHFFQQMDGRQLSGLMAGIFPSWDGGLFEELMGKEGIPMDKKVRDYSRGMRMRVQVAVALAHSPDLLILDEPTAGMDPAARDTFLDTVMGFMRDEGHTVLLSSHITSDLERISDYIVFIHRGRIVLSGPTADILSSYGVAKGRREDIGKLPEENVVSVRTEEYGVSALVDDRDGVREAYPELIVDPASLDDIMVMIIRGDSE